MYKQKLTVKEVIKLLSVGVLVLSAVALPNVSIAYSYIGKQWKKYKRGDIGRIVKRLHKQKLVKIGEKDGETIIELSEKGKKRLLKFDFDNLKLTSKRDGKLRVVSFDIPNSKKLARDIFRKKLKELEFRQVQKSIFITAFPCKEQIEFVINLLGIEDSVIVFELGKIELGPKFEFKHYKINF